MRKPQTIAVILTYVALAACSSGSTLVTEDGIVTKEVRDAMIVPIMYRTAGAEKLDDSDLNAAYSALIKVLEQKPPYTVVNWYGIDTLNSGEIIPGPRYLVNESFCQYYTHRYYINRQQVVLNGAACMDANSNWQSLDRNAFN